MLTPQQSCASHRRRALPLILLCIGLLSCSPSDLQQRDEPLRTERVNPHALADLTFADLPRFGLLPPGETDHLKGKNAILLALRMAGSPTGKWVPANALLGIELLDAHPDVKRAYWSLFKSLLSGQECRIHSAILFEDSLLTEYSGSGKGAHILPITTRSEPSYSTALNSLIFRRESCIISASNNLNGRFIYDDDGNYSREYFPQPKREMNMGLVKTFEAGMSVFLELKSQGVVDETLGDLLGMLYASLVFDKSHQSLYSETALPHPLQLYSDALADTVEYFKTADPESSRNVPFLSKLCRSMGSLGLNGRHDSLLIPTDAKERDAVSLIVSNDLDQYNSAAKGQEGVAKLPTN